MAEHSVGGSRLQIWLSVFFAAMLLRSIPMAYCHGMNTVQENITSHEDGGGRHRVTRATFSPYLDCFPDALSPQVSFTSDACHQRQCDYNPSVPSGKPWCVFSSSGGVHYSVARRQDSQNSIHVELSRQGTATFGGDFVRPTFTAEMLSDDVLRFTFDDEGAQPPRYKVPLQLDMPHGGTRSPKYEIRITDTSRFAFQIIRRSTGTVIFDTGVGGLVLSDQFLQLATTLPSKNVYGFGEHLHESFRHPLDTAYPHMYSSFSRDFPPLGNKPLYGVQPFYMCVEDSQGNSHGVLLVNSNAQEYSLTSDPMLTYRTIGGILDFYVFLGPSPENVVQQYTAMVGRPVMPAYWALGFQMCKYGYNNLATMQRAVQETLNYGIPLDVQYADIDHMDARKDFTIDTNNFGGLDSYWKSLRAGGMHTVIILDPCLVKDDNYEPYRKMKQANGNVKWPTDVNPDPGSIDVDRSILGNVWPDPKVIFPDFFKTATQQAWKDLILNHRNRLIFDGLWIDMNEPSNFATNEQPPDNWPSQGGRPLQCGNNKWDDPPYRPLATYIFDTDGWRSRLSDKTLCMNTVQGDQNQYRHYDVHNLYGWSQTPITNAAVRAATGERGMVITRSNFPGTGKYAGHWLGDNFSNWLNLRVSIVGMLEYNIFGIPYNGADICGFNDDTTPELCLRWMQLGAFYPFSRNHNSIGRTDQHPGHFGPEFGQASREILETRYWMLPYLYTLFHEVHTQGGTVVRPLHHEFPTDVNTLGIDRQFLWGPAFLISPILEEGQTTLQFYVPAGRWYDFYTGLTYDGPTTRTISVSYYAKPQLLLRGGFIFPMQRPANNTHFSRQNPFTLRVMLSDLDTRGGSAIGSLFWDDGKSIDTFENGNYFLANFSSQNRILEMHVQHNSGVPETSTLFFETITIYGVADVDSVTVTSRGSSVPFQYDFSSPAQKLEIHGITLHLADDFTVNWSGDSSSTQVNTYPPATPVIHDCFPDAISAEVSFTQQACQQRHCAYDPTVPVGQPWCFFPLSGSLRYSLISRQNTANGFKIVISRVGTGPFERDFVSPSLEVQQLSNNVLRIKFDDDSANPPRYQVPIALNLPQGPSTNPQYEFRITDEATMAFQIIRKATGVAVFDTGVGGLVLSDQFLQLSTRLPSENVFGLGENVHDSFKHQFGKSWPAFARDQPPFGGLNLYGVHPFYTCIEDIQGNTHGILLFNSNAQEYQLTSPSMLTYRTIGGIFDFYVFLGPSPEDVIQQYTELIGRPVMPPYWSLGFQLSRYGYNNLTNMKQAVSETLNYNIPLDVQYADIDHMDERKDFTVDNVHFAGLNDYFHSLRAGGMHTIIILDPALISNETNYEPYEKIKRVGGYIQWPSDVTPPSDSTDSTRAILGYVWPKGKVAFPDFFKNVTRQAWKELIIQQMNTVVTDGLWIDMNEPANMGTNEERPFTWPENERPYWSLQCGVNPLDDPPYRPLAAYVHDSPSHKVRLSDKTLCMNGVQGETNQYRHYDVHNLYGWSETTISLEAIREAIGERSIVITRSTFPSSGKYAGHWLGDNSATWNDLRQSIIGMLEFNLFGIPFVGADICGFGGDTTEELCLRWMQLGAFYPFSRNHNAIGQQPQHPAAFGAEFARASREILEVRYWLLPYLYTLFHEAHTQGGTVVRPLHHEFPTDPTTYAIDRQFMWGPALLISPIVEQGEVQLKFYIPSGRWYDFYSGAGQLGNSQEVVSLSKYSKPELHVRGGYILPLQRPANNTRFSRHNPFTLRVYLNALDSNGGNATGSLFWDDGVSVDTFEKGNYYLASFVAGNKRLEMTVTHNQGVSEIASLYIEAISVHGVSTAHQATVRNQQGTAISSTMSFDSSNQILSVSGVRLSLGAYFQLDWQ